MDIQKQGVPQFHQESNNIQHSSQGGYSQDPPEQEITNAFYMNDWGPKLTNQLNYSWVTEFQSVCEYVY